MWAKAVRTRIPGNFISLKSGEKKTGFSSNGVFVPYRKQRVLTKTAKMTNGHSVCKKNKGFAPQTPANDEADENGTQRLCLLETLFGIPDQTKPRKKVLAQRSAGHLLLGLLSRNPQDLLRGFFWVKFNSQGLGAV